MTIVLAIIALAVLIIVHELGHFLAAKACGVYVERFSVGFGKVLWSKTHNGTEYCLSAVPLGGYVKLHRMFEEEEIIEGREKQAFYNKSLPRKLIIITAGVIFNFLFAVLLVSAIQIIGYKDFSPIVGNNAGAGIEAGDRILAVNGNAVRSWNAYLEAIEHASPVTLTMERSGETFDLTFDSGAEIGASVWIPSEVGNVSPGLPADKAGIKAGDTIISIDGQTVSQWNEVPPLMQNRINTETVLQIKRDGELISFSLVPVQSPADENIGIIGITSPGGDITVRNNPVTAIKGGVAYTLWMTKTIYQGIGDLLTGKVSRDNLGGPILIVQAGARSAASGYEGYLLFMAMISINLAILNLLPIPVLDGGYVIMFIYEAIRRKRISVQARAGGQMVGMALLGLLMVFAFYNDIFRFFK